MQPFQKPLSGEKEAYYIKQCQNGDQEAIDILVEHNMRLVAYIVRKYQCFENEREDLISVGTIGLIKAVRSYDPKKGNRLATYASRCIENEVLMMFRQKKKVMKEVSIYEPIGTDKEGNEICLLDIIEEEEKNIVKELDIKNDLLVVRELIDTQLTQREREIILDRYGLFGRAERTQRELGEKYHISRSYISRIEKKALLKLRQGMVNHNR